MIIHLETKIVTLFGVMDDKGNVVQRVIVQPDSSGKPDPLNIAVLSQEGFVQAYTAIEQTRQQLIQQEAEQIAKIAQPEPSTVAD